MNDQFLHDLRHEPRPEFAGDLRGRLERQGPVGGAATTLARRWRPVLSAAAAAAVVIAFLASPTLRAYGQAFLDLFRVRNFAAVSVDPARLEQLEKDEIGLKSLLTEHVEKIREPGEPRAFLDPAPAGSAAGFPVRVPATVPNGLVSDTVRVTGEGVARLTVDADKLSEVLYLLGISDLKVPNNLDGAQVTVRMSPAVIMRYRRERLGVVFTQAKSPEVSMPQGLDLERIGEIGLRIAGLEASEARRFARAVDWHGTLLVPVPANATTFREVNVNGAKGLLISTRGAPAGSGVEGRRGAVLLWSEGEMVYGLCGNLAGQDLLQMATSLQ